MNTGHGITLTMATSGFTCLILDVTPPGATRASIDTSHTQTSAFKTCMPEDLAEWGEATLLIAFDPGKKPPIDKPAESIVLGGMRMNNVAKPWTFDGFMTGYQPKAPMNDKMTAEVKLKVSGDVAGLTR